MDRHAVEFYEMMLGVGDLGKPEKFGISVDKKVLHIWFSNHRAIGWEISNPPQTIWCGVALALKRQNEERDRIGNNKK